MTVTSDAITNPAVAQQTLRAESCPQRQRVRLSFARAGQLPLVLADVSAGAVLDDGTLVTAAGRTTFEARLAVHNDKSVQELVVEYASTVPGLGLRQVFRYAAVEAALHVYVELRNSSGKTVRVRRLEPLVAQGRSALTGNPDLRWIKMAYCSANSHSPVSRSGVMESMAMGDTIDSWWMTAAWSDSVQLLMVLGFATFRRFVCRFEGAVSERLCAVNYCEDSSLDSGKSLSSEELCVQVDPDPHAALLRYGSRVAEAMQVKGGPRREPVCAWSSWGHYLEAIDAATIDVNVELLSSRPTSFGPVEVVSIDEGWEQKLGGRRPNTTWTADSNFGSIGDVIGAIHATGRRAGVWLAPFVVNEGAKLAIEHPDWLVKDEHGAPKRYAIGKGVFALDPSHPGAQVHLTETIHRLTVEWGVRYLKLDFLRCVVSPEPDHPEHGVGCRRRFFSGATSVEAYRVGLEVIRRAAARDTHIMTCGDPLGPSIGLTDSRRVGHDISPFWGGDLNGIVASARNVAANYFWTGAVWHNDPDFVLVDGEPNEVRVWATIVALSGGDTVLSANLPRLVPWQEDVLRKIIPPTGVAARPLDLFESDPPVLWHRPVNAAADTWHLVAFFNWEMHPRERVVAWTRLGEPADAKFEVFEFWGQEFRGTHAGEFRATLPGRSVELFAIRRAHARPALVGTDAHFTQGATELAGITWDEVEKTLDVEFSGRIKRSVRLTFLVPNGFMPAVAQSDLNHEKVEWDPRGRLLRLQTNSAKNKRCRIEFADAR